MPFFTSKNFLNWEIWVKKFVNSYSENSWKHVVSLITEPKMIELIESEIMDNGSAVQWDEIAGLEFVKTTVKEIVVFPLLRPDIFHGLRAPPKASWYFTVFIIYDLWYIGTYIFS